MYFKDLKDMSKDTFQLWVRLIVTFRSKIVNLDLKYFPWALCIGRQLN